MENDPIDLVPFGKELREIRERAGLSQPQLAEMLGIQRQTISSWEQGATAPDVRIMLRMKHALHRQKHVAVEIGALLGEHRADTGKTPLEYTLHLLEKLDRCGIRDVHSNRAAALTAFLPFLERAESRVCLVASSLLGVTRVAPERVATALKSKARQLLVLMTHPDTSQLREAQEGRSPGSISSEIRESARTLRDWGVEKENIRFYRGAPTIFLLFTEERMLANPYTYQTEAFKTVTFELAPVSETDSFARDDIYSQYSVNHFENPWKSASSKGWDEVTTQSGWD